MTPDGWEGNCGPGTVVAAYRWVYDMHVCPMDLVGVVAAHHRVHDYACCHLQADCLESGISSGPYAPLQAWVPLPLMAGLGISGGNVRGKCPSLAIAHLVFTLAGPIASYCRDQSLLPHCRSAVGTCVCVE